MNGLTEEDIIAYLATLLASDSVDEKAEDLISEDQIMSILKAETIICEATKKYPPLDPVIVTWHEKNEVLKWYLGFYLDDNDGGTIRVDHLERAIFNKDKEGRRVLSNRTWKRPAYEDVQDVEEDQIIQCKPIGDWVFEMDDVAFELENSTDIQSLFIKYQSNVCIISMVCNRFVMVLLSSF